MPKIEFSKDPAKGKVARIKKGKFAKHKGLILRTGNGWVQIELYHMSIIFLLIYVFRRSIYC